MKNKFFVVLFLLLSTNVFGAEGESGIDGLWAMTDEKSGQIRSVIRVYTLDGKVNGTIIKGFSVPGKDANPNKVCERCEGEYANKKIIGLDILRGLSGGPTQWDGGTILDPDQGKLYSVNAKLAEDGKSLRLRGYLGISLFGRTVIWTRYQGNLSQ